MLRILTTWGACGLLLCLTSSVAPAPTPPPSGYCQVYGSIYLATERERPHYWVWEESSEFSADLILFEEDNPLYADREGIWYFTKDPALADFIIGVTNQRDQADFTVYFTDLEAYAGCR